MGKQKNLELYRGKVLLDSLGAIVLEYKQDFTKEGFIILCIIPSRGEYVSWWIPDNSLGTIHGHYTHDLHDAVDEFDKRK